jgi:hypothetical protein
MHTPKATSSNAAILTQFWPGGEEICDHLRG